MAKREFFSMQRLENWLKLFVCSLIVYGLWSAAGSPNIVARLLLVLGEVR